MAAGRRIIVADEITTNHRPHIRESVRTTLARPGRSLVRVLLPHSKSANTPTSHAA